MGEVNNIYFIHFIPFGLQLPGHLALCYKHNGITEMWVSSWHYWLYHLQFKIMGLEEET